MKINKFKFGISNPEQNWEIGEVNFDNINLLVGESGAGKTTILRALSLICDVAQGKDRKFGGASWTIDFSHDCIRYCWSLESAAIRTESIDDEAYELYRPNFINESLIGYESDILEESLTIIENIQSRIVFQGSPSSLKFGSYGKIPKLRNDQSAISLFSEEEEIRPVVTAFRMLYFQNILFQKTVNSSVVVYQLEVDPHDLDNFDDFKESISDFSFVLKAFLIQSYFPAIFKDLKQPFLDIFYKVADIRIQSKLIKIGNREGRELFFELQEASSMQWISQSRISAGMMRSLYLLFELFLISRESVILIDEFENGLGINCMPQLADLILEYEDRVQFILTSHHPYIINNIPWETWQLVSWEGSKICVKPATEIPELKTSSSLDKFTQLINYWEFKSIQQ
jgi:AAA15 family ATPase/GTPase